MRAEILKYLKNVADNYKPSKKIIKTVDIAFRNKKYKFINPDKEFWFKTIKKYSRKVHLKTMDLAIMAIAIEYQVDWLYSFDAKLQNAYINLKQSL